MVEISHQVFLVDCFNFYVLVSFENCFVEISLQRVKGRFVSSNIFLVEVFVDLFWYRFLFR